MRSGAMPVFLLLVTLGVTLVPLAEGQAGPVLVDRIGEGRIVAGEGDPAIASFLVQSIHPQDEAVITVRTSHRPGWSVETSEARFFLAPRENVTVEVRFFPVGSPRDATFEVTFQIVNAATGQAFATVLPVDVGSRIAPRILGVVPNNMPSPLDNAYGTFLAEMAFWVVTGLVAILAGDSIVMALTRRAGNALTRQIEAKLRKPVFYFVLFIGLSRSFAILPRNDVTIFIASTFLAIGVGIFGLYVAYRIIDSILLYYQREVAPRTATPLDDVLVPVFRKLAVVVFSVVGAVYTLRTLGWDPTLVFAGAGIAGLVIAFAAQDTFSNLFSGFFLLLDRPFVEGDVIQLESGEIARVENVGLRTTRLRHFLNTVITVPNNDLATRRIINLSTPDLRVRADINVGVAYGTDTEKVRRILTEVALAHPRVLKDPDWAPVVRFEKFGESSLDFLLRITVDDWKHRVDTASDVRLAIDAAFKRESIEIPFPQRTLWIRERRALGAGEP